jgi:hypothetical protein
MNVEDARAAKSTIRSLVYSFAKHRHSRLLFVPFGKLSQKLFGEVAAVSVPELIIAVRLFLFVWQLAWQTTKDNPLHGRQRQHAAALFQLSESAREHLATISKMMWSEHDVALPGKEIVAA